MGRPQTNSTLNLTHPWIILRYPSIWLHPYTPRKKKNCEKYISTNLAWSPQQGPASEPLAATPYLINQAYATKSQFQKGVSTTTSQTRLSFSPLNYPHQVPLLVASSHQVMFLSCRSTLPQEISHFLTLWHCNGNSEQGKIVIGRKKNLS